MNDNPTQKPDKRLIKEAIRDLLLDKTQAGSQVAVSQSIPTEEEKVPKIIIYSTTENVERFNQSPKDYRRVLNVTIEIICRGDDDDELDEDLEILAEEVETLMEIDDTLKGLLDKAELTNCSYATSEEGSTYLGSIALSFECTYYKDAIRKGSRCFPPLKTADVEWEVNSEEVNAEDEYNFEQ